MQLCANLNVHVRFMDVWVRTFVVDPFCTETQETFCTETQETFCTETQETEGTAEGTAVVSQRSIDAWHTSFKFLTAHRSHTTRLV